MSNLHQISSHKFNNSAHTTFLDTFRQRVPTKSNHISLANTFMNLPWNPHRHTIFRILETPINRPKWEFNSDEFSARLQLLTTLTGFARFWCGRNLVLNLTDSTENRDSPKIGKNYPSFKLIWRVCPYENARRYSINRIFTASFWLILLFQRALSNPILIQSFPFYRRIVEKSDPPRKGLPRRVCGGEAL
jgi:hypothetical protein